MALGTLSIDLVAQLTRFENDLGRAARVTEQRAQEMAKALGIVTSTVGNFAGGLLGALSVGAVTSAFSQIIDGLDALNDAADVTGASIENLSALEDIAARTGTGFETVTTALVKFNQVLGDATPGSTAAKSFEAIGLSVKELQALDPAEALRRYAVALDGFADGGKKARFVQDQLGKSAREIVPFLKDLAEQSGLVGTVTSEQARQAEAWNKELAQMQKNAQDLGRVLASDLVKGINAAAKAFRESGLFGGVQTFLTGDDTYKNDKRLVQLTDEKLQLEGDIAKLSQSQIATEAALAAKKRQRLKVVEEEIATVRTYKRVLDDAAAAAEAANKSPAKPPAPAIPTKGGGGPKGPSDAERYLESLQQQLEKTEKLTAVEQVLADIQAKRFKGASFEQQSLATALAIQIDAAREAVEADKERQKAQEQMAAAIERATASSRSYFEQLARENQGRAESNAQLQRELDAMGLTKSALEAMELARQDATIAQEEQTLAMTRAAGASDTEIAQMERKIELLREQRDLTAKTATRRAQLEEQEDAKRRTESLADSIEQGILTGFRDGKKGADIFINELQAQFAKAVLRPVIQPIAEAGSAFFSSIAKSVFGGFFADGGVPPMNKISVVGEQGPELFVPHTAGRIVPNGALQGNTTVVLQLTQNVGSVVTPEELARNNQQLLRTVQAGLNRSMGYGGALS